MKRRGGGELGEGREVIIRGGRFLNLDLDLVESHWC